MKILNIEANELYAGLVLYEDVYNSLGAIILPKATVLEQHHINRIIINKVAKVRVLMLAEENPESELQQVEKTSIQDKAKIDTFKKEYSQKVDEITHILKEIGKGAAVNIHQVQKVSKEIVNEFDTMSDAINYINLVRPIDDYTYAHSLNVSILSRIIARWLGLNQKQVDEVAVAGLLHDIGKNKVSQQLLSKPSRLSPEEFEEVKKHAILGYMQVEKSVDLPLEIKYAILMHHERIDGTGYPIGAVESQIPLYAKIIAVADIYDAMTSARAYRNKFCPFEVIKELETKNYGKLDTKVLSIFLKNIANSYLGDFVELSSGEIAEIVFINPNSIWQPIVRCGDNYIDISKQTGEIKFINRIVL